MDLEAEQLEHHPHNQNASDALATPAMEPPEPLVQPEDAAEDSSESEELSDDGDGDYEAEVDGWRRLMGDDIKIKTLNCPEPDNETAAVQSDVTCAFTLALLQENGQSGAVLHSQDNAVFRIGAGDTIPG